MASRDKTIQELRCKVSTIHAENESLSCTLFDVRITKDSSEKATKEMERELAVYKKANNEEFESLKKNQISQINLLN